MNLHINDTIRPTVRWSDDPKEYQRQYRLLHLERLKAYWEKYRIRNKSAIAAASKEYHRRQYALHRNDILARSYEWRRKNRARSNAWHSAYRKTRRSKINKMEQRYRSKHPEQFKAYQKAQRLKHREAIKVRMREWRMKNRSKIAAKQRERRRTDLRFAIECRLGGQLRNAVAKRHFKKSDSTLNLLGCSVPEFIHHIESLFLPGMSWENRSEWDLDHIRPVSSFSDMSDPVQQRQCFHYTNLQPLWKTLNREKSHKWVPSPNASDPVDPVH